MNKLYFILFSIIFVILVCFHFLVLTPEKYEESDLYDDIIKRGRIKIGINLESKPFGFRNNKGEIVGFDVDLAKYIAQNILKNSNAIDFIPVTPSDRMLKVSTGEVDIVIATMTITPQRMEIVDFSIPYDWAGQTLLIRKDSTITSISDLSYTNVGVIFGTTAEKNIFNLSPTANVRGFKSYRDAYIALKNKEIEAITSDDTILNQFAHEDSSVKLLGKKYSKEPYGIAFKKGKSTAKLKENIDYTITNLQQKNVITRLRKKWNIE